MKLIVNSVPESGYQWRLVHSADEVIVEGLSPSVAAALSEAGQELPIVAVQFWWDGHCLGTVPSPTMVDHYEDLATQFTTARAALKAVGLSGV